MLVVISPAKKLDFESRPEKNIPHTKPAMLRSTAEIIDVVRKLSHKQLAKLMNISDKLVEENRQRYQDFSTPFTPGNARQAALAFTGDTYLGLDAGSFSTDDYRYAQENLRILSGLYGLLRPLDLIQPYRLEMGTRLKTVKGNNLYEFWDDEITTGLNKSMAKSGARFLLNCASNEYIKAVKPGILKAAIITPVFRLVKDGELRNPGMMAKRVRGSMARFVIQNRIVEPGDLRDFSVDGYRFKPRLSDSHTYVFHKKA